MAVPASDRIWYPSGVVQSQPLGAMSGSLAPGTFASIQRNAAHPTDVSIVNSSLGLKFPNGNIIKMVRCQTNSQDTDVAGSGPTRARAAVLSPVGIYGYGSHYFFGFGGHVDDNWDTDGAIHTWYGAEANASGPMTIYGVPHPSDSSKAVIRMTRDPALYSGTDPSNIGRMKQPWTEDLVKGRTYAHIFEIQMSTQFNPGDPYNTYGGYVRIWQSVNGQPYTTRTFRDGSTELKTQTMGTGARSGFYCKSAQRYTGDIASTTHKGTDFFAGAIGRTFAAADVFETYSGPGPAPTPLTAAFNRSPAAPLAGQEVTLDPSPSTGNATSGTFTVT